MNTSHLKIFLAISVLALASVACGASDSDSDGGSGSNSVGELAASSDSKPVESSSGLPAASAEGAQRVIQTTSLDLEVESLTGAFNRASELARTHGGYVAFADIKTADASVPGSISLRVPSSEHSSLVSSLKEIDGARLRSESVETREISAEYTDLESRLRNLLRTEAQFQQFLTQAKTIDEVLNVNNRLQTTRDEIERVQGRINLYDNRVEYATINLRLTALPAVRAEAGSSTPVDVFSGAWAISVDVFWGIVKVGAAAVVLVIWLVPLAGVWIVGSRLYQRYGAVLQRLR